MSHILRTRVSASTAAQLAALCDQWRLSTSAALRLAVRYLIDHPEVLEALLPQPLVDPRTEAQRESGDAYLQAMERMDLEEVMRDIIREA